MNSFDSENVGEFRDWLGKKLSSAVDSAKGFIFTSIILLMVSAILPFVVGSTNAGGQSGGATSGVIATSWFLQVLWRFIGRRK